MKNAVRLTVAEGKKGDQQTEIMQSAEILSRELRAHGIEVIALATVEIKLSDETLSSGMVVIRHSGHDHHVRLEDAVDRVMEMLR